MPIQPMSEGAKVFYVSLWKQCKADQARIESLLIAGALTLAEAVYVLSQETTCGRVADWVGFYTRMYPGKATAQDLADAVAAERLTQGQADAIMATP